MNRSEVISAHLVGINTLPRMIYRKFFITNSRTGRGWHLQVLTKVKNVIIAGLQRQIVELTQCLEA